MQNRRLSSLDLRAFLRTCHAFIQEGMTPDTWTSYQKFLLTCDRPEFATYARQLKKISLQDQSEIMDGFSNGQIESKLWLLQVLKDVLPHSSLHIHVLGSWFGLLPRMLHWFFSDREVQVVGVDIDSRCEKWSHALNEPESFQGILTSQTQDMMLYNYQGLSADPKAVIINTSCEHLEDFANWYRLLKPGSVVVLQGNDFKDHDDHTHVWTDLQSFKNSCPMDTILFEGALPLSKYTRFMLVGVK